MPKKDINLNSTRIATLSFETEQVRTKDGPEFPTIVFLFDLNLYAFKNSNEPGNPIHPITCLFFSGQLSAPHNKPIAKFRDEIGLYSNDCNAGRNTQLILEIPLDLMAVHRIEQARTGTDLALALDQLHFVLAIHSADGKAIQKFEVVTSDALCFFIPKSQWIEKMLPGLGYGRIELLEMRTLPAASKDFGLPKAISEIRQARDSLVAGEWDKAVGHCRNAVETIPDSKPVQEPVAGRFSVKVDAFVNDHFATALSAEETKFLAEELKSLWTICCKAVHPQSGDHFKRASAEFIVRNTSAVVEYVGKLLT